MSGQGYGGQYQCPPAVYTSRVEKEARKLQHVIRQAMYVYYHHIFGDAAR